MNQGAVASRYAKAFLDLVEESGRGEQVFAQVRALLADASALPQPLEDDIRRLVLLLKRNKRLDNLKFILHDFIRLYCEKERILIVELTSSVPSPGLAGRVEQMLAEKTGCTVLLESKVDPELLGGFVIELENEMLDASVRTQIDRIRRQLVQKNKRII
jgi:F-type H+-transporting ATPase subunit delta